MIAPKMPSRPLAICDISTRIVPVQKAFSLITRRATKTDGPRIQAKSRADSSRPDAHTGMDALVEAHLVVVPGTYRAAFDTRILFLPFVLWTARSFSRCATNRSFVASRTSGR